MEPIKIYFDEDYESLIVEQDNLYHPCRDKHDVLDQVEKLFEEEEPCAE